MHLHVEDPDFNDPSRILAAIALLVGSLPKPDQQELFEDMGRRAGMSPLRFGEIHPDGSYSVYEGKTSTGLTQAEIEANNRDHELHEAGTLASDLPPAGTFEPADDTPPFVPAAGASNTSAPPAPPAPTNASANELDADGLPWDERIHSSNRKKTGDGKWWAKRGVDDQTRIKVEAELRSVLPPVPPAPPKAPAPPPPVAGTNTFQSFVKALNTHNGVHGMIPTPKINEAIAAMGITPANLPAMAIPANQLRLGELALAIGLEFNP